MSQDISWRIQWNIRDLLSSFIHVNVEWQIFTNKHQFSILSISSIFWLSSYEGRGNNILSGWFRQRALPRGISSYCSHSCEWLERIRSNWSQLRLWVELIIVEHKPERGAELWCTHHTTTQHNTTHSTVNHLRDTRLGQTGLPPPSLHDCVLIINHNL